MVSVQASLKPASRVAALLQSGCFASPGHLCSTSEVLLISPRRYHIIDHPDIDAASRHAVPRPALACMALHERIQLKTLSLVYGDSFARSALARPPKPMTATQNWRCCGSLQGLTHVTLACSLRPVHTEHAAAAGVQDRSATSPRGCWPDCCIQAGQLHA